jgi:glycosyltransferase involved in cell wall biosynthesis
MRIAIIGDYPVEQSRISGGVEAAFVYLVRELCQIDNLQVHILTLGNTEMARRGQIEQDGMSIHFLPPFQRFEFARNFRNYQGHLNSKLAQIKPDVIHAQGAADHAYVALRSGYPTVITVHGVQSEESKYQISLRHRARKWLYSSLIERYNLSHTRHLIAIGRYVTDYFASLLKPETKIYFVPNAIDESFFNLCNASSEQTILFAGRVIQRKRPLDLVQAFAKIADRVPAAQLRIAGEYRSEPTYGEEIHRFIQQAGLTDRIHLLGPLPEEAVLREFAGCAVLALPSAQETTPMVIAQAMAAGKPVIATSVGGVAEMVQHGKTGFLVNVGEIDGLADALLRLLDDSVLRQCMGQAGSKFAVENYRADSVARRTYEVYRQM